MKRHEIEQLFKLTDDDLKAIYDNDREDGWCGHDVSGQSLLHIFRRIGTRRAMMVAEDGESLFEKGRRLFRQGFGASDIWGNCKDDDEMPEVHRGWLHEFELKIRSEK